MINVFKIKQFFLKSIKWVVAIIIVVLSILYFLEIRENKRQSANVDALNSTIKSYKLKNGTLVTSNRILEYDKKQLEDYVKRQDQSYQLLVKEFNKFKSSTRIKVKTKIDTIDVPFEVPVYVEQPFTRTGKMLTKEYSFGYTVNNSGFKISEFTVPDSISIITGTKKKWFWGKETSTTDIINTNKYVKFQNIEHVEVKQPKKFYETTGFKIAVGFLGGVLLNNVNSKR